MAPTKRDAVQKSEWREVSVQELLGLSDEEARYVQWRASLGRLLRKTRKEQGVTQTTLARYIKTSQPRVAMMESGDKSVTTDLILKALFHLGVSNKEIGKYIAHL